MKVLHIAASPKPDSQSNSKRVGNAFIQAYIEQHTNAACKKIDIHKLTIPAMTSQLLEVFEGNIQPDLTEAQALQIYDTLCDEFIAADRYVISFPHWNLTAPPALISYFLAVARTGKAFKYTEKGPKGLLHNKKAAIVVSSGGICSGNHPKAVCTAVNWLMNLLNVCGIEDSQVIYCEGIEQMPERAEEIVAKAIKKAQQKGAIWDNESKE